MIDYLMPSTTQYAIRTPPQMERRKSHRVPCEVVAPNKPNFPVSWLRMGVGLRDKANCAKQSQLAPVSRAGAVGL